MRRDQLPALVPGLRYRITHRSESQRRCRRSVLVYLDTNLPPGSGGGELVLSARPVAGTQRMPVDWIESIALMTDDARIYVNAVTDIDADRESVVELLYP